MNFYVQIVPSYPAASLIVLNFIGTFSRRGGGYHKYHVSYCSTHGQNQQHQGTGGKLLALSGCVIVNENETIFLSCIHVRLYVCDYVGASSK